MEKLKEKLTDSLIKWNYEVLCETFDDLSMTELMKIGRLYNITSGSRIEICQELAKILGELIKVRASLSEQCINEQVISGDMVKDIDKREMMTLEQGGKVYCFNIDDIYKYVTEVKNINPWTNVPFTEAQLEEIKLEHDKLLLVRGELQTERVMSLTAAVATLAGKLYYVTPSKFHKATEKQLKKFFYSIGAYADIEIRLFENNKEYIINTLYDITDSIDNDNINIIQQIWKFFIEQDDNWIIPEYENELFRKYTDQRDILEDITNFVDDGKMKYAIMTNDMNKLKDGIINFDILKFAIDYGSSEILKYITDNNEDLFTEYLLS